LILIIILISLKQSSMSGSKTMRIALGISFVILKIKKKSQSICQKRGTYVMLEKTSQPIFMKTNSHLMNIKFKTKIKTESFQSFFVQKKPTRRLAQVYLVRCFNHLYNFHH